MKKFYEKMALLALLPLGFSWPIASALAAGSSTVGNGGDSLIPRGSPHISDGHDTVIISPDQATGMGYFRLEGEPGQGQGSSYPIFQCQKNPDGIGPLIESCRFYLWGALNATIALPPDYYEIEYGSSDDRDEEEHVKFDGPLCVDVPCSTSGSRYFFSVSNGQRVETSLTRIVYPQTFHDSGYRLVMATDFSSVVERDLVLQALWGADELVLAADYRWTLTCPSGQDPCYVSPAQSEQARENYSALYEQSLVRFGSEDWSPLLVLKLDLANQYYPGETGSVMIPAIIGVGITENQFVSVLPGAYNAYVQGADGSYLVDDSGGPKLIQSVTIPDRTTVDGSLLPPRNDDWLNAPPPAPVPSPSPLASPTPSPTPTATPSASPKPSCFLFFC